MSHFIKSESGAVTVDWVVLTAALVGLGLATMSVVSSGVEDVSGDVKSELTSTPVFTTFDQRNYSAFYLAFMAEEAANGVADGAASFASKMASYTNLDEDGLKAKIAQLDANAVQWQAQHDAYHQLDPETVTLAQAAAAGGYSEARVTQDANTDHGGDLGAYLRDRQSHTTRRLAEVATVKQIADERGVAY